MVFNDIDLSRDGIETEEGVFGVPVSIVVIYEDKIHE